MIPEGFYRARALEAALGNAANGNPQIGICFELLDEGYAGQTITYHGSFSKNLGEGKKTPLQRTIEYLRICGWQGDDLSELEGISDNEVQLKVYHDTWEGVTTAKVAFVNRVGGLALKAPMTPEAAKAFAIKMKGEVLAASKSSGAVRAPSAPPPAKANGASGRPHPNAPGSDFGPPTGGDDDIPF